MKLINGKKLASDIKDKIAAEIHHYCADPKNNCPVGRRPNLAIILVGDRPDSALYVNLKEKQAKSVGIDTHLYRLNTKIDEKQIIKSIKLLNDDKTIDGILVQLPLPDKFDTEKIVNTIDPTKDIDGFTKENLSKLTKDTEDKLISPVYLTILHMLESIDFNLDGKQAVIIGNSDIFTANLDKLLASKGAKVTETNAKDSQLDKMTLKADLIITAVGRPGLVNGENIKDDAVIIDIGICHDDNNKICGDVDAESVAKKAAWLTPVPGGVGPMTIAMAFRNTLKNFKRKKDLKSNEAAGNK